MKTLKFYLTAGLMVLAASASAQFTNSGSTSSNATTSRNVDTNGWNRIYVQYNPLKMTTDVEDADDISFKGFSIGYATGISITKDFPLFIETGVGVTCAFNTIDSEDQDWLGDFSYDLKQKTTMAYLTIPVNLAYKFSLSDNRLNITPYAGIYFKGNIIGKSKLELDTDEDVSSKEEDRFWERMEDDGFKQEANMFDKKEVGGKDNQWKRFQMGWQVGVGLTYNSLYVGVGYAKDFMELCRKTKVGTATITLGYTF